MRDRTDSFLSLDDFETAARRHLPHPLFMYIRGGAETGASVGLNRAAFQRYGFVPQVLRDVSGRSAATTLLGQSYAAPFGIAPMGIAALMAYRGDLVLAGAAREAGIPMVMSGSSLIPMEEVAAAAPQTWFQAYLPGEPERITALIHRVARAGFGTLVLTVDTAALANRETNLRAGFTTPLRPSLRLAWQGLSHPRWTAGTFLKTLLRHGMPHFENSYAERGAPILSRHVTRDFRKKDHLTWQHVAMIRGIWRGQLVIKGMVSVPEALTALETGADGIILSNHGGRQLDGTIPPLLALPGVARAIGGRIPVMIDGGIRRGTDIAKALALGADFVFAGRPFLYAAAVGGQPGVARAIMLLKTEFERNMALLGVCDTGEIGPGLIAPLPGG